ncbi:MAG: hypothetical protein ACI8WT_000701 [Clostridium sp.]|jgi:hypothetical protein
MKKFKMFVDMDKEEEYLNGMAKSGFMLKKYSFFGVYTFIKQDPADLHYRVDYRAFKSKRQFEEYKILFEDAGFDHVSGIQLSLTGGQYFIPKLSNIGLLDIFSDTESKLARYKRFIDQCIGSCVGMLLYMYSILKTNNLRYLTPGLWEKNGDDFWRAFIFETPVVVLRFLPFIFLLVLSIMYGNRAFKAKKNYNKSITENKNNSL